MRHVSSFKYIRGSSTVPTLIKIDLTCILELKFLITRPENIPTEIHEIHM